MKISVKKGDRVELITTDDTLTKLKRGSRGTVIDIDKGQDLVWVKWDNGEKLALILGVDKFKVVK